MSSVPLMIFNNTWRAPVISLSFNKGELRASSTALIARFSPLATPEPIMALPLSFITVFTSLKSTLICMCKLIISAIDLAAPVNTSSA